MKSNLAILELYSLNVLCCTGLYWAVIGYIGLHWAELGCTEAEIELGPFLLIFGATLLIFGALLVIFGATF